ncbi:GFA family protein [Luteimonas sp. Sa2BVA3]|uniref:GFA family protein n=1 Tax=Luteimonas colneyensis TaxID=2762230 RepID=A0ABR8UL81_9GAMM|nr:GFA family protein [Luteimonas colneyensis]MBD7988786.1 GFA family protein [Luteimonas colneyensis]
MNYQGGCHCGGIAFELEAEAITEAIDCNCSMCRRRGSLLAFFPRAALTLSTPESALRTYTFNRHAIRHHFCPTCGIAPFSEGADPRSGAEMAAVNLRCVPDVDLSALKVTPVDGASF